MSAGTITLTNNSAAVAGSGTAFTAELASGDFIVSTVGGITYTLPVKSVESDTALTLVSNYNGPTQSVVAWIALPRAAQNQVTAALVAQTTETLRGLNYDKQNWQQVFSDSGDITVMLPDGRQFSGPSWLKITDLLADIDVDALQQLADQINADAQQVSVDKTTAGNAAETAIQQASDASGSASSAAGSASSAAGSASTATEQADKATTEAGKLADFNDIVDRLNSVAVGYVSETFWHHSRNAIVDGCFAGDGQEVSRVTFKDLYEMVVAGTVPVCTEEEWWADSSRRGCYTPGATAGMFRLPDYNGVQQDSPAAPVLRGDYGLVDGTSQLNAAPNILGSFEALPGAIGYPLGVFSFGGTTHSNTPPSQGATASTNDKWYFNAGNSSIVYGRDNTTEIRMNSIIGCHVIRFAGSVQNAGSIDAMSLATRIEEINTNINSVTQRIVDSNHWYAHNTPEVLRVFNFPNGMSSGTGELLFRFSGNYIEVRGIVRGNFTLSQNILFWCDNANIPGGYTHMYSPYSPCAIDNQILGSGRLPYVTSVSANGTTSVAIISQQTAAWVMVNLILNLY